MSSRLLLTAQRFQRRRSHDLNHQLYGLGFLGLGGCGGMGLPGLGYLSRPEKQPHITNSLSPRPAKTLSRSLGVIFGPNERDVSATVGIERGTTPCCASFNDSTKSPNFCMRSRNSSLLNPSPSRNSCFVMWHLLHSIFMRPSSV